VSVDLTRGDDWKIQRWRREENSATNCERGARIATHVNPQTSSFLREEIFKASPEVKNYLSGEFEKLAHNEGLVQRPSGHLGFLDDPVEAARRFWIL
jgi:hypothetical protein